MQPIAAFFIAEHVRDLLAEADAARLAKRTLQAKRTRRSNPRSTGWRRVAGGVAWWLSGVLDGIAARLDPPVRQPSYGRE